MNKQVKRRGRPVNNYRVAQMENPFSIETGVVLAGGRSSSPYAKALADKMMELPVSKEISIPLPKSMAGSKREASNLFLNAKRHLKGKKCAFTIRSFKNHAGEYVSSRVWRIA